MSEIKKSIKLKHVAYDVRGPVLDAASEMEARGETILKLNIGNPAPFGFEAPEEVVNAIACHLSAAEGYSDSRGIRSAREAIAEYHIKKGVQGVTIEDVYTGNGVSELINMTMQALLSPGDEILIPSPDYPLWTASATLAGGTVRHYICDESSDWMPDISDIRAKITSKTRGIVDNPNNRQVRYAPEMSNRSLSLQRARPCLICRRDIDRMMADTLIPARFDYPTFFASLSTV